MLLISLAVFRYYIERMALPTRGPNCGAGSLEGLYRSMSYERKLIFKSSTGAARGASVATAYYRLKGATNSRSLRMSQHSNA